jgi:hypothetical protein
MKLYKYLFLLLWCLPLLLYAQIEVTLHQPPPYQFSVEHLWWVELNNTGTTAYTVYLIGEVIEEQGGVVFSAHSNNFQLPPGTMTIRPRDITGVSDVTYASGFRDYIMQTGTVPEGLYTICIYVVNAMTDQHIGMNCIDVRVLLPSPPRLISPYDGTGVPDKYPLFTWSAPMPFPSDAQVRYEFELVEVLEGQSVEEAITANRPWYEQAGIIKTSLTYPIAAPALDIHKQYAWQVRSVDLRGFPVGANQGLSEVWQFEYLHRPHPTAPAIPVISVVRSVRRKDNYFEITLTITNGHSIDFEDVTIHDRMSGFQCPNTYHRGHATSPVFGPPQSCDVSTSTDGRSCWITIDLGTIRQHTALRVRYFAVPVLFLTSLPVLYTIGDILGAPLSVSYHIGSDYYSRKFADQTYDATVEINNAFISADYLLVTNPTKLFRFNHPDRAAVYGLVSTVAELAKAKRGVLGFLPDYASQMHLANLIKPGGSWYDRLGGFEYLLLVGETEIIPSYTIITDYRFGGDTRGRSIYCCDYPYADIDDDDRPELRLGRIVGDDAGALALPIRASLDIESSASGYSFDRSHALLTSGDEDTWEQFVDKTNQIAGILAGLGTVCDTVHREYFTTHEHLLREALLMLGTKWECAPPGFETPLPAELSHLDDLTCQYTCAVNPDKINRIVGSDTVFHHEECSKTHSPADTVALKAIISDDDAVLVEEVRRDGEPCETYSFHLHPWQAGSDYIKTLMPDKDIYYWNGHGGTQPLAELAEGDFGASHPIAVANSCWTGTYEGIYGHPEASFHAGGAVYIGATQASICDTEHGYEFARKFFAEYWLPRISCGDALTAFKDWMWVTGADAGWRYTARIFNLYGDPKFGR